MKKIIKIIIPILILIVIYILVLSFINNKNENYMNQTLKNIKDNYPIKEKVTYSNIYGNYYILKTSNKIIVLNKEYEEILKEKIDVLAPNPNNYNLIYKNNKLMYEETILKKDKLIYKYYDANTSEFIKETNMEKK